MWEEGRLPGATAIAVVALASTLAAGVSILLTDRLGWLFGIGFVACCVAAALLVRPADFFYVGVLPPLLLLGTSLVVSLVDRGAVGSPDDGLVQGVVSGLAHNAVALALGYALSLSVLAIRGRVLRDPGHRGVGRGHAQPHPAHQPQPQPQRQPQPAHSNRETSPAPTLVTSGTPEE